jgi:hypothetical protein
VTLQRSIETAEELYRKLERTFDRRSTYGQHQVDWVFDFAVTAWHLVDWLAREAHAGEKSTVRDTQERLKAQCPELFVCEQVCNGAKHFVLDDAQLKPFNIAADVRGTNDLKGIRLNIIPGDDQSHDILLTPVVLITDRDQTSWEAIELFRRVLSFWQHELGLSTM